MNLNLNNKMWRNFILRHKKEYTKKIFDLIMQNEALY